MDFHSGRAFRRWALAAGLVPGLMAAGDWPQWRGPLRDGHIPDAFPSHLETPTAPLWRLSVAHGYASPVVADAQLIFLDDVDGRETAHSVDARSGKEQWRHGIGDSYTDEFEPGPRCTPLIDGDRVYVQTCRGEFQCLGRSDGVTRWRFHFEDYGAVWINDKGSGAGAASRRGNSGSPVIVGDTICVQIGSAQGAAIGAFNKKTGKLRWKSQNDLTCYSSMVAGRLGGVDHVISATVEGLLALSPENGQVLWRVPFRTGANRNALTPILDNDTVYFSSHTTGMRATAVRPQNAGASTQEKWFNSELRINLATPVLTGGFLYGHGPSRNYVCVNAADGHIRWSQTGFGEVTSTLTDGKQLLLLNDRGEAILVAANPDSWREVGRFQACGKTFVHPAWADGVLFVRDSRELVAWPISSSVP